MKTVLPKISISRAKSDIDLNSTNAANKSNAVDQYGNVLINGTKRLPCDRLGKSDIAIDISRACVG